MGPSMLALTMTLCLRYTAESCHHDIVSRTYPEGSALADAVPGFFIVARNAAFATVPVQEDKKKYVGAELACPSDDSFRLTYLEPVSTKPSTPVLWEIKTNKIEDKSS